MKEMKEILNFLPKEFQRKKYLNFFQKMLVVKNGENTKTFPKLILRHKLDFDGKIGKTLKLCTKHFKGQVR